MYYDKHKKYKCIVKYLNNERSTYTETYYTYVNDKVTEVTETCTIDEDKIGIQEGYIYFNSTGGWTFIREVVNGTCKGGIDFGEPLNDKDCLIENNKVIGFRKVVKGFGGYGDYIITDDYLCRYYREGKLVEYKDNKLTVIE